MVSAVLAMEEVSGLDGEVVSRSLMPPWAGSRMGVEEAILLEIPS